MTFTVTYREKSGAKAEAEIEAASRAECVAECKARGIAPMVIREGRATGRTGGSPVQSTAKGRPEERAKRKLSAVRFYLLVAVAALAAIAWWWLAAREDAPPAPPPAEKPKAASRPEARTSGPREQPPPPPAATNRPPTKEEKRAAQLKAIRDKYGDNIPDNLKPVVYFLENPPQKTFHPAKTKASIFRRRSEREIASMVMTEPGTWFMRKPVFNERFDEDFKASLGEKIEFSDDDTDEQKALKQAVIDTKAELAERMKAGESPSAAMNAFADSMYELGQYRRMLQDELGKIKRDASFSDQDVQDFVNAANKMLKDKGAQPIPMPKMVFRQVSLKRAAAKAEEKARKAQEEKK